VIARLLALIGDPDAHRDPYEDLRPIFERWYPAMTSTDGSAVRAA
jgi:hypothetical protein